MSRALFWKLSAEIIHTSVTEICFCKTVCLRKKRVTLNPGLRSGICISVLMLPGTKSERIKQPKKLLLCYSSSKPEAVYSGGLWEWIVINLSRNIHRKAKLLHIAQQKKYSTIRGHHCYVQNWVMKSICSSWKNWLFAVKLWDVESGCSVWCPSFYLFQRLAELWQNFQQTPP